METKTMLGFTAVLGLSLLVVAGCGKKADPGKVPAHVQMYGVALDTPRLDTDFTNASPEVQQAVLAVKLAIRRGQFSTAIQGLEQLARGSSLTEPQKQLASNMADQLSQVVAKSHPAPAPP